MGLQAFSDTNMLGCPTRNGRIGSLNQRDRPNLVVLHCSGI